MNPHGGILVRHVLEEPERSHWLERRPFLRTLQLDPWHEAEAVCLATGVYSPLTGFMDRETYRSVVAEMRLPSGIFFPLPVTLPLDDGEAAPNPGEPVCLTGPRGLQAILQVRETFAVDPAREARQTLGTDDTDHPGVVRILAQGRRYVAGEVLALSLPEPPFADLPWKPAATRALFDRLGHTRIVGFQTRNPVHRAHEYLLRCALEQSDALLLHPLVGETKADDVPAGVRMESYRLILQHFPPERVILALYPAPMRYAGPREALLHALCRQNYGCTHFIVGRDHAGVGAFYHPYGARHLWESLPEGCLQIQPLFFEHAFHCYSCGTIASPKTCPHGPERRLHLSGTAVRKMLRSGTLPPPEFTRPEVARLLADRWA